MTDNAFLQLDPAADADISAALSLAGDVFDRFEAPCYPSEGVKAFHDFLESEKLSLRIKSCDIPIWVCKRGSEIIGMMALRDGNHVCLAFTAEKYQRQGVGKGLFAMLEKFSASKGFTEITVNSSPYGMPFYKALGFLPSDMEQINDGIIITPMIKQIH
ncbi:MAG: GNAT family N-acetyltransferase [Huintestinicola sp.]